MGFITLGGVGVRRSMAQVQWSASRWMEFNLTRDHLERVRSLFKSLWGRPNKANANVSGVGQASCIFLEHLRFYEPT
jgi:hypothetical protein